MKELLLVLRHDAEQFKKDRKYQGIITAFRKQGYNVSYIVLYNGKIFLIRNNKKTVIGLYRNTRVGKFYSKNIGVYKAISGYCIKTKIKYDLCYVRMMPATRAFYDMFKKLHQASEKVIVEIPSYPLSEELGSEKRIWRHFIYKYFFMNIRKLSKYVDLYVVIGDKCKSFYGVHAINISNGIDLNEIPPRSPVEKNSIHILALAKMARWHGYDRLIEGMRKYYNNSNNDNIVLHMVGNDGDGSLEKWKEMTLAYNLENKIIFEGALYGKDLDEMFDFCDVAIASLGLHRKNSNITSELKIREYCARGIPFIYSAEDPDLDSSCYFCKKVPLDNSAIDINMISEFVGNVYKNPNVISEMRKYCESFLSWDKVIDKIISSL